MTDVNPTKPASHPTKPAHEQFTSEDEDRRKFLASCERFAVITPPTTTMLLSPSPTSAAIAATSVKHSANDNNRGNDNHR